jgi:hypothetical protein
VRNEYTMALVKAIIKGIERRENIELSSTK